MHILGVRLATVTAAAEAKSGICIRSFKGWAEAPMSGVGGGSRDVCTVVTSAKTALFVGYGWIAAAFYYIPQISHLGRTDSSSTEIYGTPEGSGGARGKRRLYPFVCAHRRQVIVVDSGQYVCRKILEI